MLVTLLRSVVGQLLLISFLVIFCRPVSAQLIESAKKPIKDCQLTFGWDLLKPYQYSNASGQVVGLQIDLVKAIVEEMGCTLNFQNSYWDKLVEQIHSGEVDFMADVTITEARSEFGYFSDSYRQETFSIFVLSSQLKHYLDKSIKELLDMGFRFGVTKGYLYSDELEKFRKLPDYQKNFVYANSNIDNYDLILENKIDGFLEDSLVAGYNLRSTEKRNKITALPSEYYRGNVSFLFSKKSVSKELVDAFNKALESVKQSKEYEKTWLIPSKK